MTKASTGSTSFTGSSQISSPCGRMLTAGNHANTVTPNNITTNTAMTNSGRALATSAVTDNEWSIHESRRAAAHMPSTTPRIVEMIAVSAISTIELARRGPARSHTDRR